MGDVSGVSSSGTFSALGVGSNLDLNGMLSKLMDLQNQPVNLLQNQNAANQTTVSAFGQLQSALSQFQTAMQGLNSLSRYQSVSASVGNTSVATVSATSAAVPGTYSLLVSQLAQTQSLVAAGQQNATSAIGVGTISFNFGTTTGTATNGTYGAGTTFTNSGAAAKTVTINSSNNSLTGIAGAINAANIGVTASIINDGSGNPYRLSLSSSSPGAANSMQISVSGDTALQNLLNQDPSSPTGQNLTQTSAAQNAQFTLNGLAISSSTNTASSVIPGVTLNLLSSASTTPTTLTVSQSNSGTASAITTFVAAYNSLESVISQATAAGSSTQPAGPLQGQNSVLSISRQLQSILNSPVPGAPNMMSMLAQVGVKFQADGSLSIDNTKMQAAIANNPGGVAGMFASNGMSTDALISFNGSTSATQPGAYGVSVTQNATTGTTVGSAAANTTISAGVNDTLLINLNGVTSSVTLAAGNYTAATLAAALQTAINGNSAYSKAGSTATVSENAGVLSLSSNKYGSSSVATITGGNGQTDLFGSSATSTTGLDVAGTINGQAATGKGQVLTGGAGLANGLAITVNGGPLGARGVVNFTQGYVNELNNLMTSVLGKNGQIASATDGLNATIKDVQKSVSVQLAINQQVLNNLKLQFSALDVTMSSLTSTSNFLTQQLAALPPSYSSK